MSITVQNLIDWGRAHAKLAPIVSVGGVTNEPALSIANDTIQKIIGQPYKWKWNRASATNFLTVDGTEEYTLTMATDDFAYIDRAYIEPEAATESPKPHYPLEVVWEMQKSDIKFTPMTKIVADRWVSISTPNVVVRFDTVPDATIYRVYIDYQKKPPLLTALTGAGGKFDPIPDDMGRAIRQTFLASVLRFAEDPRANQEMNRAEQVLAEYHKVYGSEQPYNPHFVPAQGLLVG